MKKNLLTVALLALSLTATAQNVICSVNKDAVFFVGENALVYNGGGIQTVDNAVYDVRGNVMIEGGSSDDFKTLKADLTEKTTGGNFILRMNTPGSPSTSTYGQLYINGLSQLKVTAVVDKEYRTAKQGTYQQVALPFNNKLISSLSGTPSDIGSLGKVFSNARYSQNEILTWNNATVVSENLSVSATTPKNTAYYMVGSKGLDTGNPPSTMPRNSLTVPGTNYTPALAVDRVYTLRGAPYSSLLPISENISGAGAGIFFGTGGNNLNGYNEKYNTYLQDQFQFPIDGAWSPTFGKNIYQFGNPFLTNIDLSNIGRVENATPSDSDGNNLTNIWGIRYDPGTVTTLSNGSTYSVAAKIVTYTPPTDTNPGSPIGDTEFIIKPMQVFVMKMRNDLTAPNLNFNTLRRFKYNSRALNTPYSVTASKGASSVSGTIKQLAVIGLDVDNKEIGRTYFVVSPNFLTGHQSTASQSVQAGTSGASVLGTFEEDPISGGYDQNHLNYLLYINEANENDFEGKALPLAIYNSDAKKLRFEILENGVALENGVHNLSTGIGFFYKAANGTITEIKQKEEVAVTADEYGLYYGEPSPVLASGETKVNRTIVVYSSSEGNYIVQFDPKWKKADVKVYDMSGKLVINELKINTNSNYIIKLSDQRRSTYVVAIESENGEKVNTKILK